MVGLQPEDCENLPDDVQIEMQTDCSSDGEGTVYAIQTAEHGNYRVDWKIGHIDGTFAEGVDYYYEGEHVYSTFYTVPENAPSGMYKNETFHELLEHDTTLEDGELTITKVYDADGLDTAEWAAGRFDLMVMDDYWMDLKQSVEERELDEA